MNTFNQKDLYYSRVAVLLPSVNKAIVDNLIASVCTLMLIEMAVLLCKLQISLQRRQNRA